MLGQKLPFKRQQGSSAKQLGFLKKNILRLLEKLFNIFLTLIVLLEIVKAAYEALAFCLVTCQSF